MLYGFGDVIVVAVGGFLLLPLYTRVLTQAEFGIFTIIKTNTEILTYLLQFGLISTVGRLYFEYRKKSEHYQYLSSVFLLFLVFALISSLSIYQFGEELWDLFSPNVPAVPYIWFSLAIALFAFCGSFSMIWLRVEEKAGMFIAVQIASAIVLLALVILNLVIMPRGLIGLLYALVISAACGAAVLPFLFRRKFTLRIKSEYTSVSLHYGLPIFLGYIAYFITNKVSLIILQRHVSFEQLATFGIAQQMGMIVTVVSGAFLKSLQPAIFSAEPKAVEGVIDQMGRLYLLMMFFFVNVLILFASDIFKIVAPTTYSDGFYIFTILLFTGFLIAANFVFGSTLLYFKLAKTSVFVTVFGGCLSLIMGLILIPQFKLIGAALSIVITYIAVTMLNYWLARKCLQQANFGYVAMFLLLTIPILLFAVWLHGLTVSNFAAFCIKIVLVSGLAYFVYWYYLRLKIVE